MAVYYFDSSAIAKRYVKELGSAWIISLTEPATNNRILIARITGVEVVSAITRRGRSASLSPVDTGTALTSFYRDFTIEYRSIEMTAPLLDRAMVIAETNALRGYDAVQLATALEANTQLLALRGPPLIFVCADTALNMAASAEGLTVDNPNAHP